MSRMPTLAAPDGACDTHIHIYDDRYPLAPTAVGKPPTGGVEEYRAVQRRLGLQRTVVVQPSAYGTDNRCTVEAVHALGPARARAVAVVDQSFTGEDLDGLTQAGVVGARFLMLPGGAIGWNQLDTVAAHVAEHGWHVQLQLDGRTLPDRIAQIRRWTNPLVIDHIGKFLEPVGVDDPAFRCLLDLVERDRAWVKLSAPYEVSQAAAPHWEDVGTLAKALVRRAPERMIWASNWPHPAAEAAPDDADLLDVLLDWTEDETTRGRILAENPTRLYGFDATV